MRKLLACVLILSATSVLAMGSKPAKEEPKYKLEILKMEVLTAPASPAATVIRRPKPAPAK